MGNRWTMSVLLFLALQMLLSEAGFSQAGSGLTTEPDFGDTARQSKFEAVQAWFEQGQAANFEESKGFYAGRCFGTKNRNTGIGSLLGYIEAAPPGDSGPGFQDPNRKNFLATIYNITGDAKYFDDESSHPSRKWEFLKLWKGHEDKVTMIRSTPTHSYLYDWEGNNRPDENREFKKGNGYIIQKATALIQQKYGDNGVLKPGDTIRYCYYFKKFANVAPKPPAPPPEEDFNPPPGTHPGSCQYVCYLDYRDCMRSGSDGARCRVIRTLCESRCRR